MPDVELESILEELKQVQTGRIQDVSQVREIMGRARRMRDTSSDLASRHSERWRGIRKGMEDAADAFASGQFTE